MEIEKDLNLNEEDQEEYAPDLISLLDEEGIEHQFEIADVLENDDENYMALIPVFDEVDENDEEAGQLVILKVIADGDEEFLEAIDDEDEFNKISKIFMDRLGEDYDFEE